MHPACPNPCNDCPFRKNSLPGWLGAWPSAAHLSGHVMAGNKYPCHQNMNSRSDYDDMGTDEPLDDDTIDDLILIDSTQCKGSMLYQQKGFYSQFKGKGGLEKLNAEHDNILTPDEFIAHHQRRA